MSHKLQNQSFTLVKHAKKSKLKPMAVITKYFEQLHLKQATYVIEAIELTAIACLIVRFKLLDKL